MRFLVHEHPKSPMVWTLSAERSENGLPNYIALGPPEFFPVHCYGHINHCELKGHYISILINYEIRKPVKMQLQEQNMTLAAGCFTSAVRRQRMRVLNDQCGHRWRHSPIAIDGIRQRFAHWCIF
jgi:hypothetical protein